MWISITVNNHSDYKEHDSIYLVFYAYKVGHFEKLSLGKNLLGFWNNHSDFCDPLDVCNNKIKGDILKERWLRTHPQSQD